MKTLERVFLCVIFTLRLLCFTQSRAVSNSDYYADWTEQQFSNHGIQPCDHGRNRVGRSIRQDGWKKGRGSKKAIEENGNTPVSYLNSSSSTNYTNTTESSIEEIDIWKEELDYRLSNVAYCQLTLSIYAVTSIDEIARTITLDIDLDIVWKSDFKEDHFVQSKVSKSKYLLKPAAFNETWKPDILFENDAKLFKSSLLSNPANLVYRKDSGTYRYFSSESLQLYCQEMNFAHYPADTQRCFSNINSYSSDRTILFELEGSSIHNYFDTDPNFEFQVESEFNGTNLEEYDGTKNDTYERLDFTMSWRRKMSYHMIQTYLPSTLYMLIACLCFLVPSPMIEVRIGISMTTLLTLTAMFASVRQSTPSVSYAKAIDIWMVGCIFFVFLTLLQFTSLLWLRHKREIAKDKSLHNQRMLQSLKNVIGASSVVGPVRELKRSFSVESLLYSRHERIAESIEKYGVFVFTSVFMAFTVIYWTWLLVASEHFNWKINATLNGS